MSRGAGVVGARLVVAVVPAESVGAEGGWEAIFPGVDRTS